jgi:hypothetical protein
MTGDDSACEEEQPDLGCGCAIPFGGLGMFLGLVAGERFYAFQRSAEGGTDESGSMGIILPSSEEIFGAFWGGVIGVLVFLCFQAVCNMPVAERKKRVGGVLRAIFVATSFVGVGLVTGALVGQASMNVAIGAALGGTIGLAISLILLMRAHRE